MSAGSGWPGRAWQALPGLIIGLLLSAFTHAAGAAQHALLVGVSSYPTLAASQQLRGPAQDVMRFRDALLQRGFDARHIRMLADGVDGAELPTRAAILGALAGLADAARDGDRVVLLFSGHGSQQPTDGSAADARAEPDGWHETFLPRDVGRWDGTRGTVVNAITDTTLREAVDRISERGAAVWALFDACHSATLVRGSDEASGVRVRQVPPTDLGVPAASAGRRARPPGAATPAAVSSVRHDPPHLRRAPAVYFYAAQSTEAAVELPLPLGVRGAPPRGLFSFTVAGALASGQPMSYRQLADHVLFQYGGMAQAQATPLFSGDGLDEAVLGQRAPRHRQWPLDTRTGLSVPAGSLDGLAVGARFIAVADPLAPNPVDIARLPRWRASAVHPGHVELVADTTPGSPAGPAPAVPAAGTWLRLISNPPSFGLRVAADLSACRVTCPLAAALTLLQREGGVPGVAVQWVAADDRPDVLLQATPDALRYRLPADALAGSEAAEHLAGWPLPPAGSTEAAPEAPAKRLAEDLHALARTRNLLRLATEVATRSRPDDPLVSLSVRPARQPNTARTAGAGQVHRVAPGDGLVLAVTNGGRGAIDATVLSLDAHHGITALFPRADGESNRLEPGSKLVIDDLSIDDRSEGVERLMLIWAPARRQQARRDFSSMQQPPLTRTRGTDDPELQALFDACFADHVGRDGVPALPAVDLGMRVFTLRIVR